jgi:hypothetical protein
MVMRRAPVHPCSLPLNRTTTPLFSARVVYTDEASELSGIPSPLTNCTRMKLASNPPIIFPIPCFPSSRAIAASRNQAARTSLCASISFTFLSKIASPGGDSALVASTDAGDEILYGAFIQLSNAVTSGAQNAIPSRIPARPNALDRVCRTMRLGYCGTEVHCDEWGGEKST